MSFNTLQRDCAAEGFHDTEPLIHDTVRKFQRSYGGDYEDLLDIALYSYVKAFKSFDSGGGSSFPTWVRYYVWTDLFNLFLKTQDEKKRIEAFARSSFEIAHNSNNFLTDFLDELNDDAKTITHLILSTPDDFQDLIKQSGGELKKVKKTLYSYLRKLGWQRKRILQSYSLIEKALQ